MNFDPVLTPNIDPLGKGNESISMLDSPAVIACFDDVAVVRKSIEQGRGHFLVIKDRGPLTENEIGAGDDSK